MMAKEAGSLAEQVRSLRARLYRERLENRRRNALFSTAIRTNDLREVGAEMYRYFYRYFDVSRGDITILKDYEEREFYDLVGWTPRQDLPGPSWYRAQAVRHCAYLRGLVEEQIFIGYAPESEQIIRDSLFIEQSMLECMVTKAARVVNNVAAELSLEEVAQAREQQTQSWMNWIILHPDHSRLLAKLHMSFSQPRQPALRELTRRLQPFEELMRYRILHTRDFKRIKYLSERDVLTGFYLRPVLVKLWAGFVAEALRGRRPAALTVAMLDIDFFKRFNDRYGHDVGDAVLKRFSQAISDTLRGTDMVGRYGGEEFVAMFPGTIAKSVRSILSRVHDRIKDTDFLPPAARARGGAAEPLRFSAGIFTVRIRPGSPPPSFDQAIKAADELLLGCKRGGRNCCAFFHRPGAVRRHRFD